MNITVDSNGDFLLREVFNGVNFKTAHGESFSICMRDTGFEFYYQGDRYSAKEGKLEKIVYKTPSEIEDENNPMLK